MSICKTIKNNSKPSRVKNVHDGGTIEEKTNRYIRKHFELEEDYYQPVIVGNISNNIISKIKVIAIKIKPYPSENTLIKLNHTWNIL